MLDSPIAMFYLKESSWLMLVFFFFFGHVPALQQNVGQVDEPQVAITAPVSGQALQGVVAIQGTSLVPGFQAAEVSFGYQSDPTNTWFLIQQSGQPVLEGQIASWDTTTIADGEYRIRLQVFLQDGQVLEMLATGLRVRNYTPVETSTPAALPTGQPSPTPSSTPFMDFVVMEKGQTPLPTNPAQLTPQHFGASVLQGVLVVFGGLLAVGLYIGIRWLFKQ